MALIESEYRADVPIVPRILASFSLAHLVHHIKGTRCKPWDDRELDVMDGLKVISFFFATSGNASYMFVHCSTIDFLGGYAMNTSAKTASFIANGLGVETFFMISAFFTAYRCF